ncbi:growth/differentiation factor 15 [Python bivittatus]|uniref:Growth/differentiation factor 15 n=1 Tax=Python bivittatus TaxID=176946 RepID=A0A9F5MXM9_PYTBI|nr:growth/differentiation factor 15 [Python bivittatus]
MLPSPHNSHLVRVDPRPHRGHDIQLQLEAVKQGILMRLGLERPPTILGTMNQEEIQRAQLHYQELLAQLQANQTKLPASTTIHLLRPEFRHVNESTSGSLQATNVHLEFSRTAAFHQNLNVLRAELTLFKEWLNPPSNSLSNITWPARVNLYRLSKREKVTPELLTSQVISRTSPSLSLKGVVEQWVASSEPKLYLGLEFRSNMAAWLATTMTKEGTEMLMIETETRKAVRKARQLDEEECRKGDGKCCLRSLKVSFEAIGWSDWVVAPRSYSMKFCEGSCPHNYKPASMHAQIKARLHSLSGETPAPCCVPAAYEPMVLMHYGNDGNVATQLFDDMIVTRCHCA